MDQASGELERRTWWRARRLRYNVLLVVAGAAAFVAYAAVISLAPGHALALGDEPPEFTLFSTAFQALGYATFMLLANACYGLGAAVERLLMGNDAGAFRRVAFAAGIAFSVALPFIVPAVVLWKVLRAP